MKVKHTPGDGAWTPFAVTITFEEKKETERFYEELQRAIHSDQIQAFGSYIESCSEEQVQQREQSI